jgi:hypothetical protein
MLKHQKKLLVIITEAILEKSLIADANPTASTDGKLDGHTPASRKLLRERILQKLTPDQKAESEKKAMAFVAKKEKP